MNNSAADRRSPLGLFPGQLAPRLYDRVVEVLRARHYSRRTEEAYLHWICRFLLFHNGTHPRELAAVRLICDTGRKQPSGADDETPAPAHLIGGFTVTRVVRLATFAFIVLLASSGAARQVAVAPAGTLVETTVASIALKGNLLGDPGESGVAIYLPPSYVMSPERRYPTLYLLHGYVTGVEVFGARAGTRGFQGMQLATTMDDSIGRGAAREMIVVAPNGRNAYFGSFYTNSSVTGGWEDFIVQELVPWIDAKYRTIPRAESRGIAGHSMGGYGAIMLAMKHPDVFSALYALSPCCIGLEADIGRDNQAWLRAIQLQSRDQLQPRPRSLDEFYPTVMIALSAAFSPNPDKPPLYVDLPFRENNGRLVVSDAAYSKWRSKMPLYLVEQYRGNLEKLRGIYLDYGALEEFSHIRVTTRAFADELASRGIPHTFEVYAGGDHENKIRERIETRLLRFFSEVLSFR